MGRSGEISKIEVTIPTEAELLEELMEELEKIDEDEAAEAAEILEVLIEADDEIRTEIKEKATQADAVTTPAPQPEQVDEPVKVKVEPPLSDGIVCTSSTHHFGCTEVSNEEYYY